MSALKLALTTACSGRGQAAPLMRVLRCPERGRRCDRVRALHESSSRYKGVLGQKTMPPNPQPEPPNPKPQNPNPQTLGDAEAQPRQDEKTRPVPAFFSGSPFRVLTRSAVRCGHGNSETERFSMPTFDFQLTPLYFIRRSWPPWGIIPRRYSQNPSPCLRVSVPLW